MPRQSNSPSTPLCLSLFFPSSLFPSLPLSLCHVLFFVFGCVLTFSQRRLSAFSPASCLSSAQKLPQCCTVHFLCAAYAIIPIASVVLPLTADLPHPFRPPKTLLFIFLKTVCTIGKLPSVCFSPPSLSLSLSLSVCFA